MVVPSSHFLCVVYIGKQITSSFAKLFYVKYLQLLTETSEINNLVIITLYEFSFDKDFRYLEVVGYNRKIYIFVFISSISKTICHSGRVPSAWVSTVFNAQPCPMQSALACIRIICHHAKQHTPRYMSSVIAIRHRIDVLFCTVLTSARGHVVAQWLRHCDINRKVAGSIPDGVTGIFY
jgi:hypothetical protein